MKNIDIIQDAEQKTLGLNDDQYATYQYSIKNLESVSISKRKSMLKTLRSKMAYLALNDNDLFQVGGRLLKHYGLID